MRNAGAGALRDVILTQEDATVEGLPDVHLREAVIVGAVCGAEGDPHRADAHWGISVEKSGSRLTLYGPWVTLAWLGRLAGWSTPEQSPV